jgi:hypothetical protein
VSRWQWIDAYNPNKTVAWTSTLGTGDAQEVIAIDQDGDGYGDPSVSQSFCPENKPSNYISNDQDCDDDNSYIKPGATEICNDSIEITSLFDRRREKAERDINKRSVTTE